MTGSALQQSGIRCSVRARTLPFYSDGCVHEIVNRGNVAFDDGFAAGCEATAMPRRALGYETRWLAGSVGVLAFLWWSGPARALEQTNSEAGRNGEV